MQCQVVTNSECSNYRHYFQSEIAQFPRMRSLWLEKKTQPDRGKRQWFLSPCMCVCVRVLTCACMVVQINSSASVCTDPRMTLSIAAALDKSRNGSCQSRQHLAPQLSPFTAWLNQCKPHQAAVATQWWARCVVPSLGEQFEAIVLLCDHQCKSGPAHLLSNFCWRKLEGSLF